MNLITLAEGNQNPADNVVFGVELYGLQDGLALARRLGAYGLSCVELTEGHSYDALAALRQPLGAEALTLQARLIKDLRDGAVIDGVSYSLPAVDAQAGR